MFTIITVAPETYGEIVTAAVSTSKFYTI